MSSTNKKTIRLGLCMAGAASAGAYTAGVVDYLVETLERWQKRKDIIDAKTKRNEPLADEEKLIPMHDVVIEVLSGASAGGMTGAVLAYSFNDNTYLNKRNNKPIEDNYDIPAETDTPSKLYQSWIEMVDDRNGTTFKKLMDTGDIVSVNTMKSVLNSMPIDDIATRAIPETINFQPPAYISPYLSIILSVTNLEGVPVDIRFSNIDDVESTCNVLTMHSGFLHYQFKQQLVEIDFPAEILTNESKDHLAIAAKATGAFPLGLANRKIVVKKEFFDEFKRRLGVNYKMNVNLDLQKDQDYVFNAIDGGTINNEPIGTTVKILDSKKRKYHAEDDNYLILVDPFPTVTNAIQRAAYKEPDTYSLFQQVSKIIRVLRNQSMFRQEDLLTGLQMERNRYLIYPSKRKFYFLACGLLGGFSGFFLKKFRQHDYQLGRKNCQTFLRYYFGESIEEFKKATGSDPGELQLKHWRYDANYGKEGKSESWKIPLIPDMLMLKDRSEINTPLYNGMTTAEFETSVALIRQRLAKVLDDSYPYLVSKGKGVSKVIGWAMKIFPRFFKNKIANAAIDGVSGIFEKTFYPQSLKQADLLIRYADIIEKYGDLHQKSKGVFAKKAKGGEYIKSTTTDGAESDNIASPGDFIVTNDTKAKEQYIVKAVDFWQRYKKSETDEGYYLPLNSARVYALQITRKAILNYELLGLMPLLRDTTKEIYIEAPWYQAQKLMLDDFLVCPVNKNEVYRIALKEFHETYKKVN